MVESPGEAESAYEKSAGGLSTVAAIAAAAGAVVLAFLFYRWVGFPENVPLAFGASVLVAEIAESVLRGGGFSRRQIARALVHGLIVAGACWLGVWIAYVLGWSG